MTSLDAEIAEFERRYRAMPKSVKIGFLRRTYLGQCLRQRALVKRGVSPHAFLKQTQDQLRELRVWRASGRKTPPA